MIRLFFSHLVTLLGKIKNFHDKKYFSNAYFRIKLWHLFLVLAILTDMRSQSVSENLKDNSENTYTQSNNISYNVTMIFNRPFEKDFDNLTSNASKLLILDFKEFVSI